MSDGNLILVNSCQLEYIKLTNPSKQKPVSVELLTGGGRELLRILSIPDKSGETNIIEDVDTEKIGAAVIITLEQRNMYVVIFK